MNYVEFWLLDNAVIDPLPLFHLNSEFDEYDVRELWGYSCPALLNGLEALLRRGEIVVFDGRNETGCPTRAELDFYLNSEHKEYREDGWISPTFRLTARGGRVWGEVTHPQWDRFADGWPEWDTQSTENMSGIWSVVGTTRDAVSEYMRWFAKSHPTTVVEGTGRWEELSNYPLTYWKTGQRVVRGSCHVLYDRHKPVCRYWSSEYWEQYRFSWYTIPDEFASS